jgi:hypothetical protein
VGGGGGIRFCGGISFDRIDPAAQKWRLDNEGWKSEIGLVSLKCGEIAFYIRSSAQQLSGDQGAELLASSSPRSLTVSFRVFTRSVSLFQTVLSEHELASVAIRNGLLF